MKHFYFLLLFLFFRNIAIANENNVVAPSATINGTTTVCQNSASPLITFTGSGGTAPYTFTYTVTGTPGNQTITTTSGNSVTVSAPTGTVGTFTYTLVSVHDTVSPSNEQIINGQTAIVTVISGFTVNTGADILVCRGNPINLTSSVSGSGTNTVTYSWSGPNGYTSNQQSPTIGVSSMAMSGNYTVTASIGNCQIQDLVNVTVAEPQLSSGQLLGNQFAVCLTDNSITGDIGFTFLIPSYSALISTYSIDWDNDGTYDVTYNSSNWNNFILQTFPVGTSNFSVKFVFTSGCTVVKQYSVFVGSSPSPATMSLFINQATGCLPHTTQYTFNVPSTNVEGTTYVVSWGDGTPDETYIHPVSLATLTHVYNVSSCGHNVILNNVTYYNVFQPTVVTQNPCSNPQPSGSGLISVGQGPNASFIPSNNDTSPIKACTNQALQLTNTSNFGLTIPVSNGATCLNTSPFYWTITPSTPGLWTAIGLGSNNGQTNQQFWTSGSLTPSVTFNAIGTYVITLRVKNNCGDSSVSQTFCVESPLTPLFTLGTSGECTPVAVTAINTTDLSNQCSTTTYLWQVTHNPLYCATTTAVIPNQTTANASYNFTEPGTYSIKLTVTNSCTPPQTTTQIVTVIKKPTVSIANIAAFCQSASLTPSATVDGCAPLSNTLSYSWSFPGGIPSSANTAIPPAVSYTTAGNHTVSLSVTNICGTTTATSNTFVVQAAATVQNESISVCSGVPFSVIPSDTLPGNIIPAGTTYSWVAPIVTGGITGGAAGTNQTAIGGTLINPTNIPQTATYTVTPKSGTCLGIPFTIVVTVNPSPVVTFTPTPQTICSGDTSAIVTLSSVAGAVLSWTATQPTGITGVATSGTNIIPAQTLTNSTNAPITITYNANATTSGSSTCAGALYLYTITVKPSPRVTENFSPTVCSGVVFSVTPFNSALNTIPTGTTYSWAAPIVTGGMTGGSTGNAQSTISGTLTNPTDITQTATYSVIPSTNGCTGTPFTVTVTVNPKPTISNVIPPAICSGNSFTVTPSNGGGNIIPTGTTYTWTISANANLTGQSASTIAGVTTISQMLTNNTNTNQTITYTVTPTSGVCPGATFIITVTVSPKPSIANFTPPAICSGTSFTVTPSNGSGNIVPTGTTYTWGNPSSNPVGAITGGSAQTIVQTNISQTLTNTTNDVATLTYTVTPISGSCTGTPFTIVVTVNPIPTSLSLTNQVYCNGVPTTVISFSNTVVGTTYAWTNSNTAIGLVGSGTGDIPVFTPTNTTNTSIVATISVIATANGCSRPAETFTITVNPAPTVTFTPVSQVLCSGDTTALVTLNSTITGATFNWSAIPPTGLTGVITSGTDTIPTQTLINTTNAPITVTYNATATTASGSTCAGAIYSYTIIVNPNPSITESFISIICSGNGFTVIPANSALNSIPTGTTYSWPTPTVTGGITGGTAETLQSTITGTLTNPTNSVQTATYQITPSYNGCTGSTFTVTVTVNPKPSIANITPSPICSETSFTVTPSNGSGAIVPSGTTYTWTVSTNTNITGQSASNVAGITSISQTLTNSSNTDQTLIYTVTPTTGNCPGTDFTIIITINPKPTIADLTLPAICSGDSFIFTPNNGSGTIVPTGTTYTWSNPVSNPVGAIIGGSAQTVGQNTISQTLTNITNDLATITYTVTPISGSCIGNPFTITVTLSPRPIVLSQTIVICSTATFSILPINSGGNIIPSGTTYTWTTPTISPIGSITGATSETVQQTNISQTLINTTTSPATATYTVTPTSGTCVGNSFTVTVTVNPSINPNVVATNNICFGVNTASITTNLTGGIPFSSGSPYLVSWTGPNSFTSSATNISSLQPGIYNVTITDAGGCPFSNSYTITEPTDIVITVDSENDITCYSANNGSINISVTGGTGAYSYNWTKNSAPYALTEDISNLSPGTYVVTVTDANNCGPKMASFTITEPPLMVVSLVSQTNVLCYGSSTGAITVDVIGGTPGTGYNFSWSGPNGFTSNNQNLVGISAGSYNLIVTDANACVKNLSVIITQSTEIIIAYITTPITCYGANNASMSVTLSGGNPPYQFQWSNLSTSLVQTNLSAGNYTITVTDNVGCIKTQTIVIPEAPIFTVNPIVTNISCNGAHNGSINLNLTGGIAPVALTWSDGSTAGLIRNNLGPGTYTATISDGTPCYIVSSFTIIEPQSLVLSANITNAFDCTNAASGVIDLVVAGGTPPYTYSWSNGTNTEDLTNITSGNYLVTVTDANGCVKTSQYSIVRQEPIAITVSTQTDFDCAAHTVNQNYVASVSGGIPPYQLQWSSGIVSGANNEIMHSNVNGTVLLTVIDSNGCSANYTVTVDNPVLGYPSFDTTSNGYTTYGIYSIGDPIQFQSTITGSYISVSWDFGDGTFSTDLNPIHTYLIPKDYIVTQTVTYPFGCVYIQTISLLIEKGYVLVVPTAFTPNNDSVNDTYRPVTKALKNVTLDIYDTWGSLIYSETGDVLIGWDGKIKNFNAENGNYYSKVSAETFYGTIVNSNQTFVLIK